MLGYLMIFLLLIYALKTISDAPKSKPPQLRRYEVSECWLVLQYIVCNSQPQSVAQRAQKTAAREAEAQRVMREQDRAKQELRRRNNAAANAL